MPCGGRRSANWKSRNFWSPVTISRFLRATRREWIAKSLALRGASRRTGCRTIRPWCSPVPDRMQQARDHVAARDRVGAAGRHAREGRASTRAAEAVCEAHFGNAAAAKERARAALELAKGRDVEYAAAFALALSGDSSGSQRLAADLEKRFPEDTPVQFEYLPTLHALSALAHRAPLDAVERLQTALPYDFAMPGTAFFAKFGGLYPAYVRGQAYLAAGRGQEAAAEFQKVLDHRGIVLADPIGALAHLQLGRAYACLGRQGPRPKAPTRISSPSGRMPTRTSPSSNRPAQNTRSYSHSGSLVTPSHGQHSALAPCMKPAEPIDRISPYGADVLRIDLSTRLRAHRRLRSLKFGSATPSGTPNAPSLWPPALIKPTQHSPFFPNWALRLFE